MARDPLRRLGANVRSIRHERELTQEQLAHVSGLSLSNVGASSVPSAIPASAYSYA